MPRYTVLAANGFAASGLSYHQAYALARAIRYREGIVASVYAPWDLLPA